MQQNYEQMQQLQLMYRLKTEVLQHQVRKLQIKIPNFSHSQQKQSRSTQLITKARSNTLALRQKSPKQLTYSVQVANNGMTARTRIMKLKMDSKSPKNKSSSPNNQNYKNYKDKLISNIYTSRNVQTSRNMEEVKKKLQSYKLSTKMSSKFFKKQNKITDKLEDMNKTLKRMAEQKNRKPKYELRMLKKLGKSQTGDIILAVSNINGMLVAIKTFQKQKIKLQYLIDQMKIHLYCSHPNILPAYGFHVGRDEVFLVMEYGYCNLYEEILRTGPFSEEKTANYVRQILNGIQYLHRNGIMHRDLKPENVICFGDLLKITDFGWSIKTDRQRRTLCGTLDYISPQVAERALYDNKIDCWSIGVLMYQMLMVKPPFIQQAQKYNFNQFVLPSHLSGDCKDLLSKMLEIDPQKRLNARQALQHVWIKSHRVCANGQQVKKWKQLNSEVQKVFHSQI